MSWQWRMIPKLKTNWLAVLKLTWGIWWILTQALKSLTDLHFEWLLLNKVFNIWPKKVHRSYLSWHWTVIQNFKKNWLVVWKMTWRFGKFSPEHSRVSKLGLWWGPLVPSRKCMSLKLTEELCVMTMKNDEKFEEELTWVMFDGNDDGCKIWRKTDLCFQKWHEEFGKFA